MATPIFVTIPHSLGQAEARRRLTDGFAQMRQQMTGGLITLVSMQERWEGDRLHFQGGALGQTIRGRLDVLPESVQIQIDLPEILATIASSIATRLKGATQLLLTDRRE